MKSTIKFFSILTLTSIVLSSCGGKKDRYNDSKTGWNFNDPNYGNYLKGDPKDGIIPPGMVHIEGGTFTMGLVQDDVMFDWNTTPKKMHVRSFYMDETEVTNAEYGLFLQYTKDVFPPSEQQFKNIYPSIVPDTLVWRRSLGNTNLLSENYLRHPAYADYPVVGVSWIQAEKYCKWRTNAVNLKILMDKGVIKNIFKEDSITFKGKNNFDTDTYLANPYALFDGDSSIYEEGLEIPGQKKGDGEGFTGRQVTSSDGILAQKFRLPTESEWEYAAKANFENREYNNIRGRKKYAWQSKYTRNRTNKKRGDQMGNFKQGQGDYSGIAGWSSDGADIPAEVRSYDPNAFGLYDMSGNVAEWVQDVYRPIIDSEASDFNYFRGNIFTKTMIDDEGKAVIVGEGDVEYDTLVNGMIVPRDLPGSVKYIPVTKNDVFYRRNYNRADNSNLNDGDQQSSQLYMEAPEDIIGKPRMYNSPEPAVAEAEMPMEAEPQPKLDENGEAMYDEEGNPIMEEVAPAPIAEVDSTEVEGGRRLEYDKKTRTTLISDKTRVFKGGSWNDREYWLDPAQRRYFPQYISTSYIGFRCATDKVGPMRMDDKKRATPKFK